MATYFIYFFAILLAVSELSGLIFMGAIVALCVRLWHDNPHYSNDIVLNKNLHMFLSSLGAIFLTGNGLILFRVLRNFKTSTLKHIHVFFLGLTLLITIWGIWCGFKEVMYREKKERKHLHSLHAVLGVLSLILLVVQYIGGFLIYTTPLVSLELTDDFTGLHGFVGVCNLFFNAITAIVGISMKANEPENFDIVNRTERFIEANYNNFTFEFKILFAAAIFITFFTWNFFYITVNPYFEWTMIEKY